MSFESPSDLWLEHSNFLGCSLGAIAYGSFTILYFITTYKMLHGPGGRRRWVLHLIYISVLFAVTTVNVAMSIRWNMITFIDNREYPGGPIAFSLVEVKELIVGNATYILSNFLTDGLVLYRCFVIWRDNYAVMAIPSLLFLASTALSILMVYQTARPGANLWSTSTVNFAVPYWSSTISLNIVVTLLISGRLLFLRKQMVELLGSQYAKRYTSAIAMIVESAALYTGTALLLLVTYVRSSYVQNLVWPVLVSVMPAAPLLILLRVASGTGFSRETSTALASGEFSKLVFTSKHDAAVAPQIRPDKISPEDHINTKTKGSSSGTAGQSEYDYYQ